ncbi:serine hydrolase FSH [Massariosphaeria phaeospora]|uniref:Serine hydrolase FSH n=1 Tax=Massariosphaeria phaeospora TaxID=100035 RepID=A0A7C8M4L8_9PLEO|nr:serine hydrolase FSH [Massariosphaeria phaeospora]
MRFLCLHGRGTDAQIFKDQTARICEILGEEHEFIFIDGDVPARPMIGMTLDTQFGEERLGFWPLKEGDKSYFHRTYYNVRGFIQANGPFFGLMGFSEGASVAATILIEDLRRHGGSLGLRCAIFFCGVPPLELDLDLKRTDPVRALEFPGDGVLLQIPTAHIWSSGGGWFPDMGKGLLALCDKGTREEVIHDLGHDVPGSRSDAYWRETVRAIERTVEKAKI